MTSAVQKVLPTLLALGLTAGVAAGVAGPAVARESGDLTLVSSVASPAPGDTVELSGRRDGDVRPAIRLQKKTEGSWHRVATSRAVGTTYRFTVRATEHTSTYRVSGTRTDGRLLTSRPVRLVPSGDGASGAPGTPSGMLAQVRAQILGEVNDYRVDAGLAPLEEMAAVDTVATAWSKQMAADQVMSHNPDYAQQIPPGWTRAGENVAYGYAYTEVTTAWYNSPGHRANMLGDYTHIGIGFAESDDETPYYTQNFAKY